MGKTDGQGILEGWTTGSSLVDNSNILIAYYQIPEEASHWIQEIVGGDLLQIDRSKEVEVEQYEIILLGYTENNGEIPKEVQSFLEEYDFGAKTIIPFLINKDVSHTDTIDKISEMQPGALIRDNALILPNDDVMAHQEEIKDWAEKLDLNHRDAIPKEGDITVAYAIPTPKQQQTLYLWEEGNMPKVTEYTENNGNYADDPDFRPYLVSYPARDGVEVKGAILINAGGAFQFRSNQYEGEPVAKALSELGYQCFVVNYRLRPYTQEEGALDLARAVRFVRSHAEEYAIDPQDIAVMGFSAGGILAGEMLLNYDGDVNGSALSPDYIPDQLDQVSADAAAAGMIYSFYGRLSVASNDVEKFAESDLPPTYFCYGTRDPFVGEFEKCIEALEQTGVLVETNVLEGMPHGYGDQGGWILDYDKWLSNIFETN